MYGGYWIFLAEASLILAWTLVYAFAASPAIIVLSRAMQGVGVAALQPAAFSLIGTRYPPGKRRNLALGIYSAVAPLGFFAGIATSGLVVTYATWRAYFYAPAGICLLCMALVHVSTSDRNRGRREGGSDAALQMDWMGAVAMAAGLFSTMYALAAASHLQTGWRSAHFAVALALGVLSLLLAAFIEVLLAACPLLPPDFFRPRSLPAFYLAALFFYAIFGVFLFYSLL